jgi:hypothetical protein
VHGVRCTDDGVSAQSLLDRMGATSRSSLQTQRVPWQSRRSHGEAKARASVVSRQRSESAASANEMGGARSESAASDASSAESADKAALVAFFVGVAAVVAVGGALLLRRK